MTSRTYCFTKRAPLVRSFLTARHTIVNVLERHLTGKSLGQHRVRRRVVALEIEYSSKWESHRQRRPKRSILDNRCRQPSRAPFVLMLPKQTLVLPGIFSTYNLYRCNAPHQLLKKSSLTVGKLSNAVPNEPLLVLREAVAFSPPQQTGKTKHQKQKWKQKFQKCSTSLQYISFPSVRFVDKKREEKKLVNFLLSLTYSYSCSVWLWPMLFFFCFFPICTQPIWLSKL